MKWRYLALSFLVGFLSLSEEIVWVKIVGFLSHSVPQAFSFVLLIYVFGIAIGAFYGARLAAMTYEPARIVALIFMVSSVFVISSPYFILFFVGSAWYSVAICCLIFFTAAFKGAIFPLVHHWFSKKGKQLGLSLSSIYFANVMGSAVGPLFVGFWLLDFMPMMQALVFFGYIELFVGAFVLFFSGWRRYVLVPVVFLCSSVTVFRSAEDILPRLVSYKFEYSNTISHLVENRHGVIYTVEDPFTGNDKIYGGNVYDGGFNVSLVSDTNGISRAYLLAALQPKPRRVLFIGLSSGSWLQVVAAMPGVESIDVVEINSGYSDLIKRYDGSENIFDDARINIRYGDGRQWVKASGADDGRREYDLIVMNTTWHWRAYASNLLSQDFFKMLLGVMSNDAVVAFNTTSSLDVLHTANSTFPYSYSYMNFAYVSNVDLSKRIIKYSTRFCEFDTLKIETADCKNPLYREQVEALAGVQLKVWDDVPKVALDGRKPEIVTDDNMITEYKYGRGLFFD